MGTRIAAVVLAVAMVVGALAIRNQSDEGSSGGSGGTVRLVCASGLDTACTDAADKAGSPVDLVIEPPGQTAARLRALADGADPELDAWVAPSYWPQLVDAARVGKKPIFADNQQAATGRVALVIWKDRAEVLSKACGLTLACLADAVSAGSWEKVGGQSAWGRIKVAVDDPTNTGIGLATLGALAMSSFGNESFGRLEIEQNANYQRRRASFAASATNADLATMLAAGPGLADAVIAFEPDVARIRSAARFRDTSVVYPANVSRVPVTLATTKTGGAGVLLLTELKEALLAAGWSSDNKVSFPDPGVMAALLEDWTAGR